MIDYHIHPDFSIDADSYSMLEYCQKAIETGLKEICFTTHCEFDESRSHLDWFVRCCGKVVPMHPAAWLENYFTSAEQCRQLFGQYGLAVKIGLEAGFDLGLEEKISKVLEQYPFDFVIGSVHCLDHIAISSGKESAGFYAEKDLVDVSAGYFRTLKDAIESRLFDVIGHLDIYRRHGTRFFGDAINEIHSEFLSDIFRLMVATGTGLELNTSSLRHGQGDFYPAMPILKEAVLAGVNRFTVGSDCHRLSELGQGVSRAMETAENLGISFSVYERRIPRIFEVNN